MTSVRGRPPALTSSATSSAPLALSEALRQKARKIFQKLKRQHPDATIELNFTNPLELLVATVLSAQCTDVRVNQVTPALFKRCRRPEDYVKLPQPELEKLIMPTGFFRQKAKSIRGAMSRILDQHSGTVPQTMELLTELPGIGRKTANVILGNAFGLPGLPVDTHVRRVSRRLGLVTSDDPVKIEQELALLLPRSGWSLFSHTLIFHGRRICKARTPLCEQCIVQDLCDYYQQMQKDPNGKRKRA